MTWFAIDDKLHSGIRAARAGIAAVGAFALAGSWCADHRTDGRIPREIAHRIARAAVWKKASTAGLVVATPDGYELVDYLAGNPSRAEILERTTAKSEAKQKAGRAGGLKSGKVRRGEAESEAGPKQPGSKTEAASEATADSRGKQPGSETKLPSPPQAASDEAAAPAREEIGAADFEADRAGRTPADLLSVARKLADQGSSFGKSCLERAAKGWRFTDAQRTKLEQIRDEWAAKAEPPPGPTPEQKDDFDPLDISVEESAAIARRVFDQTQSNRLGRGAPS